MGVMTTPGAPPPERPKTPGERLFHRVMRAVLILLVIIAAGWGLLYATCGGCNR